jgi:hypothetical protein
VIQNIEQIDRGYQYIDERLRKLGAEIKRFNVDRLALFINYHSEFLPIFAHASSNKIIIITAPSGAGKTSITHIY